MRFAVRCLPFVLLMLLLTSIDAHAQYVYTIIDYPGSVFTDVRAVNNAGEVVGYASNDNLTFFSFYYRYASGTYALIPPGPLPADVLGINDAGTIVGSAEGPSGILGFILEGGTYTFFAHPGWLNTYGRAISNSGIVTGYVDDGVSQSMGFIYDPSTGVFTDIPIGGQIGVVNIAQGINAAGTVAGNARLAANAAFPGSPAGHYGYVRSTAGTISLFRARVAGILRQTRARGINDSGQITGFYLDGTVGDFKGFLGASSALSGFELPGALSLEVPGSVRTIAEGINNAGHIVGLWNGADGRTRGFIATLPDATPPAVTASISGAAGTGGWYTGPVTVTWNVLDPDSPVTALSGCGTTTLTADTPGTSLTCSATSAGGTASQSVTIRIDQTAPTVACNASPAILWPPNHKMIDVAATVGVTDGGSGAGGFRLVSVSSNEPDNGLGDGDQPQDIQGWIAGTPDVAGRLRAERSGKGTGRIYSLLYRASDAAGNTSQCTATVAVPHDR